MSLGLLAYPVRIVNDYQRDDLAARIRALETNKNKPILVTITDADEKRSNAINRLAHMWYSERAKQGGEYTMDQVKCIAKLKWGVPIMKRHRKFNDHWIALTEYQEVEQEGKENLVITPAFPTYEKKIELMDWLPVTSLMTNPEMSEFMNYFQAFFANKYQLTDPKLQGIEL
jgi:hypothetical protein|tara:strand:- start:24 stop:539 length:516 start_codon:yes stop_codon:yes gene_type:complete